MGFQYFVFLNNFEDIELRETISDLGLDDTFWGNLETSKPKVLSLLKSSA